MSIFCFHKVEGDSMFPSLRSGDFVIATRLYVSISVNDIILVKHPEYGYIIKRVTQLCLEKGAWLVGDGQRSVSSEQMGWINLDLIDAKVIFSIKRKV
ncbi:S24/S26 family peptidase [Marinomonas sp. PE14-40]|uniref:S24/S26 family peptidase n=1 Tax=Marinomonas sp. PE14-40 TaxID=3060621 RepID=UPI003F66CCEE